MGMNDFHLDSMWASIIRLTSSAIDIPRRLASRFRNVLCGSVNEIICLVIELNNHLIQVFSAVGTEPDRIKVWERRWVETKNPLQMIRFVFWRSAIGARPELNACPEIVEPLAFMVANKKKFVPVVFASSDPYRLTTKHEICAGSDAISNDQPSRRILSEFSNVFQDVFAHTHSIPRGIQ